MDERAVARQALARARGAGAKERKQAEPFAKVPLWWAKQMTAATKTKKSARRHRAASHGLEDQAA